MPVLINTAQNPASRQQPETVKWLGRLIESSIIVLALGFGLVIRQGILETTVVTTGSMQTTIEPGDRLLVDHRQSLHGQWARGDIILFHSPPTWGMEENLVKRIIGVPGDKLSIFRGQVVLNGSAYPEAYLKEAALPESYDSVELQPGEYFVMGDNRNNSDDSRDHGPINDGDIEGRITLRLAPLTRVGGL